MIVDAHAHACGDFLKGEDVASVLDRNGVDKVILVPGEYGSGKNYSIPNIAARFPNKDVIRVTNSLTKIAIGITGGAKKIDQGNEYVFSLVNQYPDRIIQFYWVKLSDPHWDEKLDRYFEEYKFKGIKLHQCWESFEVNSESFHQVANWAAAHGLPIFIHLFSKGDARQLAQYIKSNPKTLFIIAHLFGLEQYIAADITTDNIFLEISPPPLVSIKRVLKAIEHFGASRILMGSDTPYGKNNQKINLDRVRSLNLSDEQINQILGENIIKILYL